MSKLKIRFMLVVCQFIKEFYQHSYSNYQSSLSTQELIDDLNTELEKE